jgi:hypothetical protein
MRITLVLLTALIAGCATDPPLDTAPPRGVDLSGHWRLNVADSDDPLRIPQSLGGGAPGGAQRSGRNSRNRSENASGPVALPVQIPTALVAELLRWPGSEIVVRQQGGVATFDSGGDSRVYEPAAARNRSADRAARRGRRSATPATCGWSGASLVVRIVAADDQPGYEARYRLSDDGDRLLQVITMQDGRLSGFTLSRVWDRQ